MKRSIEELVNQPMSRREFLWQVGAAALTLVGITGLLKALHERQGSATGGSGGYGASSYGGGKDDRG